MKKELLVFATLICIFSAYSQDCKDTRIRVYGGSDFVFTTSNQANEVESRGTKLGFGVGLELNKYLSCKTAAITGLAYYLTPFEYWNPDIDSFRYTTNVSHLIELPIGLKFKTNDNQKLTSFYFQLAYTNNFVVKSSSVAHRENVFPTFYQTKNGVGTDAIYNPGGRFEIGIQNRFNQINSVSLALNVRTVFHNMLGGEKANRVNTVAFGLQIGYYF